MSCRNYWDNYSNFCQMRKQYSKLIGEWQKWVKRNERTFSVKNKSPQMMRNWKIIFQRVTNSSNEFKASLVSDGMAATGKIDAHTVTYCALWDHRIESIRFSWREIWLLPFCLLERQKFPSASSGQISGYRVCTQTGIIIFILRLLLLLIFFLLLFHLCINTCLRSIISLLESQDKNPEQGEYMWKAEA